MIVCDPRNAPWMSWWLGYRLQSGYVGWYKLCTTVGIYGKVFRTGYGWVEPYRLPYSLDLQLPAAYANIDSGLCPSEVTVIDRCPVCGKVLTPETNDESCPDTPYWHGRHALFVYDMKPSTSLYSQPQAPSQVTCDFPMIPVAGGGFLHCNEPRGHAGDHAYTSPQYFV